MDEVDYSSDRLERSDIWEVPSGGMIERRVDIPRLGQEEHDLASFLPLRLEDVTSSSKFLVFSPVEQLPVDYKIDSLSHLPEDFLGSQSWREAGSFFPRNPGFPATDILGELEVVKGSKQVEADEEAGHVLQGKGSSGEISEEEWRDPLGVAEQRGFGSPCRVTTTGGKGVSGEVVGRQAVEGGCAKRR